MSADDDDKTQVFPRTRIAAAPPPSEHEATMINPRSLPASPAQSVESHSSMLPVGTMMAEFKVTGVLGEGGFGIVYLAHDTSLDRRVALKEYMPSALAARSAGSQVSVKSERHRETFEAGLKSFVNEAKLLASFDHPSLLKVYRFWESNGTAYMVMPFIEGITLKQQLKDLGQPPTETWLMDLLAPLTEALEVIHREQCYHRDIAPDNVMLLKGTNRPLLLDFGAARRVIGDMTQALTVILKPGYAPIEQYAEVPGMKQGGWTDVYALAAVVYFSITGKTPPTSVGRLMNDNFVSLTQVAAGRYSERFTQAVDRALKVRPEERTQSIAEFRTDLGLDDYAVSTGGATVMRSPGMQTVISSPAPSPSGSPAPSAPSTRPGTPAAAAAEPANRMPMLIGGGIAAVLALGAGLYFVLSPGSPPADPKVAAAPVSQPAPGPAPTAAPTQPPVAAPTTAPAPAPAPVPAPASPPAAGPFDPIREFEKILAAQTAGFTVEASTDKPRYKIKVDPVNFTIKSAREGFAYLLLHGTDGNLMQIYPNGDVQDNRIKAGAPLKLAGQKWGLIPQGPAGVDQWVVIVSKHKRDFSGAGMKVEDGFGHFPKDRAAEAARGFTGRGSVMAGKPVCPAGCEDEYGAAGFSSEEVN
ncbi:MAG: protein kinase domain-containing protein [Aquabacterium sp.]